MKLLHYGTILSVILVLMVMDFKVSIADRLDHLIKFSHSIRDVTSSPGYKASTEFPYNVPSFVVINMMDALNKNSDNIWYREVSNNPVNPNNQASDYVAKLIDSHSVNSDDIGLKYRLFKDNYQVYLSRYAPIIVSPSCLTCHGSTEAAPKAQKDIYGEESGYGYDVGDLYGYRVVTMDITVFLARYIFLFFTLFLPFYFVSRRVRKRLVYALNHDMSSGALNKNYFMKNKHKFRQGYVCLFDIDDFKQINDCYGHAYGDLAIEELCKTIQRHLSHRECLFRFGGEEFILFVDTTMEEVDIHTFLQSLLNDIRQTKIGEEGSQISLTVSVGAAEKSADCDIDAVVILADEAMYHVKKSGKDNYLVTN